MSINDEDEIRSTAQLLYNNAPGAAMSHHGSTSGLIPPSFDIKFLGGYMEDGRMSVVRRFFCLFVTFDLFFVSLLWLICIMLNGDNIFHAFQKQIVHYSIYTSLFDVVVLAIMRFTVLLLCYAILYLNHWIIIALSTTGSCLFLISKVFVFDWLDSSQQVFEVILIITSFVLAWAEAWFFDCRVIPQERHSRRYFSAANQDTQSPLRATFLTTPVYIPPPESVANFYSPLDSPRLSISESDAELKGQYKSRAIDIVNEAYKIFESDNWKIEKLFTNGDIIKSTQHPKFGKVYKLTAYIKYPPKALLDELFNEIDTMHVWNPTVLETTMVLKISSTSDIIRQVTAPGGGGMIKSRDFVNLRCWRLFINGTMCDESDSKARGNSLPESISTVSSVATVESVPSVSPSYLNLVERYSRKSVKKSVHASHIARSLVHKSIIDILSKNKKVSLEIENDDLSPSQEDIAQPDESEAAGSVITKEDEKVWISAACSVQCERAPVTAQYIRGQNVITAFALREWVDNVEECLLEWIICLDLKGYVPRYVLETAYTTFMADYIKYLRKHIYDMRLDRKTVLDLLRKE